MSKIKSFEELTKLKEIKKDEIDQRSNSGSDKKTAQIKVGMGTSGIASGAKEVYEFLQEAVEKRCVNAMVTLVGDMGYCYAEPTIEVILPGEDAVIFGDVDTKKADDIIESYIKQSKMVDGVIPENFEKVTLA